MFTGIVESIGTIRKTGQDGLNLVAIVESELAPELKVDQSICHNGVCLTVEDVYKPKNQYRVSVIDETLRKSTLGLWQPGIQVNLERSLTLQQRLDGHLVQGHVDEVVECIKSEDRGGSVLFSFHLLANSRHLVIPHGSVTLDGISLTIARLSKDVFTVAIIPYTMDHTIAKSWKPGKAVNVEYDMFGKYFARYKEIYSFH